MSGPESYTQNLSRQRLRTVHQALNERGITPELIDQEAFGEKRPRVTMPDGAPNFEIAVLKSSLAQRQKFNLKFNLID